MALLARTAVSSIALYAIVAWSVAEAAPTITVDYEGGFAGAIIKGSGWVPGEKVKLQTGTDPASDLGTVTADAKGNIDSGILPKNNLIDAGDSVFGNGATSGKSAVVIAGDTSPPLPPLMLPKEDDFSLHVMLVPTNLPEVGFVPGFVDLIGTSSNVNVVSQTTLYDPSTDTLTTNGLFDFLATGPVVFTYEAVGGFPLAVDPATGDPLTGTVTSDWTVQIGTIVPETGTWAMLLLGFGGLMWARRNQGVRAGA
jgi:hypothetical protein